MRKLLTYQEIPGTLSRDIFYEISTHRYGFIFLPQFGPFFAVCGPKQVSSTVEDRGGECENHS